jgi:predicted transcriptional regulator
MERTEEATQQELAKLTSDIVSAYVTNNKVASTELPDVIASVHSALRGLDGEKQREPEKLVPMVPIKKSITPDHLISLEDGRRYKSLKRHLSGRGLTPAQYREKWGLAKDYPMVAPNYAKQRSELARALGLGQQRRKRPAKEVPAEAANVGAELSPPRKRRVCVGLIEHATRCRPGTSPGPATRADQTHPPRCRS